MARRIVAALAALLLMVAATGGLAETLVMGIKLAPSSMDPHFRLAGENDTTLQHLYARVIQETPDLKLSPGIALSWRTLDDTKWEFKLRPNAKFSDGTPITAEDVIYSLNRIPRIENSPGGYIIFVRAIQNMLAVDPLTLHITTKEPYPFLAVDMARIFVVPRSLGDGIKTGDFNDLKAKITSGPYRPVLYVPQDRLELEANPHWYGGKPAWDRVVIRQISSDTSRVAALLAGDVQAINEVPIQDMARVKGDAKLRVSDMPGSRVMYVAMDMDRDASPYVRDANGQPMTKNPLKDVRVRQALSYAINRQAIIDRVLEGAGTIAGNLLPAGFEGTSPNIKPDPFDPARAKALLKEAGYPQGFQLTLHATNDRYPNDDKVAQAIAQMWARIDVKTEIETQPNATFFTQAARQNFSVMAAQYGSSDISMIYRALVHSYDKERNLGSANRTRHSSAKADEIVREALRTMEPERRSEQFARASEVALREDQIINLLYYPQYVYASRANLAVVPHADGRFLAHFIDRK
ncbi:MAG: ABC transporter substrate-binding protein [Alphaproteobacteria bacterium]|nr:ABC transporter substrate-binding protein [Alphaproteobacteria bacterium]